MMREDDLALSLSTRVDALTAEVAMLRESIVTAAEWDAEARQERQVALDSTLATVRIWLRILVGVTVLLLVLEIWIVILARHA